MENEIMETEEIEEVDEVEVVEEDSDESGNSYLIPVIIGAAAIVGTIIYKKVVKPLIAKVKAKKEEESKEAIYYDESDSDGNDLESDENSTDVK